MAQGVARSNKTTRKTSKTQQQIG